MTQHTPGPWRLDRHSVLIPLEPYQWAEAYGGSAANARLIAAAPDLLQCVEKLLAVVHDRERDDATVAAVNAAEGLIARVRGDA